MPRPEAMAPPPRAVEFGRPPDIGAQANERAASSNVRTPLWTAARRSRHMGIWTGRRGTAAPARPVRVGRLPGTRLRTGAWLP